MTSHLESTKEHASERKNQLKLSLSHLTKTDKDRTVVFGGDLNLRDNEVWAFVVSHILKVMCSITLFNTIVHLMFHFLSDQAQILLDHFNVLDDLWCQISLKSDNE